MFPEYRRLLASQLVSDNLIKIFVPLYSFENALITIDEQSSTRDIHLDLIRILRGQVQSVLKSIDAQCRVVKEILWTMTDRIIELHKPRGPRKQKGLPPFTLASVYKNLQPWFKECMKQKVEMILEREDDSNITNQSLKRLPNATFVKDTQQFFSYVK